VSGGGSTEPSNSGAAGFGGGESGQSAPNADEDEFQPILPGRGESDYERYLRTDELLSLQKAPHEWAHRDELLFQTVHQSSELWLKHAWMEVEEATRLIEARDLAAALRLLNRANRAMRHVVSFLEHLELISPWEYQEVRRVLGHGSGFDSPGFREIRRVSPGLLSAFDALRRERGLTLLEVYTQGREHEDLYQLAEALIDWDEQVGVWRFRHVKMVGRVIGEDVVGTQGTPVELLAGLIKYKMYPELWSVRTDLTELAKESD
jgi:tryptophan 2,3-dioxygenase